MNDRLKAISLPVNNDWCFAYTEPLPDNFRVAVNTQKTVMLDPYDNFFFYEIFFFLLMERLQKSHANEPNAKVSWSSNIHDDPIYQHTAIENKQ